MPLFSWGQPCGLRIKGRVLDESTGIVLPFASIYNKTTGKGAVADSLGNFNMSGMCPGTYTFQFDHLACKTKEISLTLLRDTTLNIFLEHQLERLSEVTIRGKKEGRTAQVSSTIDRDRLVGMGGKNLADIIEDVPGVSTLKTGAGVSKPVIHGLYGNRVTILNNGIAQSGQQWGNDHAPEIDPFVADHISVVRGASALLYAGSSLGGVVLVEPGNIPDNTSLDGSINYLYQSNGQGHTLNARIGRSDRWAAWRITGTLKLIGDGKTPDYNLTNTGRREEDLAVQLQKKFSEKWETGLYYSMFNTNIGILRGSHIGNVTDLEGALSRAEPLYTAASRSYSIEAPHQEVQHHLLKLESHFLISDVSSFQVIYGGQLDNRKEYDVRRGGRSDKPALSLLQNNQYLEATYDRAFTGGLSLQTGLQFDYTDNANDPQTGVLPLIPDYRSYKSSSFLVLKKQQNKLFYEFGARYDLKKMKTWKISDTYPRVVERISRWYRNYGLSGGLTCRVSGFLKANLDMGLVMRAPEVNELYSYGLHQGVSGIEIGNPDLEPEKSFKLVLSTDWNSGYRFSLHALAYIQSIRDYIYLQPQAEFQLTIRGAFPLFKYMQTDARLTGSDLSLFFDPLKRMRVVTQVSLLKGWNTGEDIPLINMAPCKGTASLSYSLKDHGRLRNNTLSLNGLYVSQQKNYREGQDFLPPPGAYFLFGCKASSDINLKNNRDVRLSVQADNLLNRPYRDYMDRLRYYADEPGFNLMLRLSYLF
jgi:iron complex outermembrane receptor protein